MKKIIFIVLFCIFSFSAAEAETRSALILQKTEEAKKLLAGVELSFETKTETRINKKKVKSKKTGKWAWVSYKRTVEVVSQKEVALAVWDPIEDKFHIIRVLTPYSYGAPFSFQVLTSGYDVEHVSGRGPSKLVFQVSKEGRKLLVFFYKHWWMAPGRSNNDDPKVFEKLAKSITPSVWGYDEIKKSLILQLFGGVKKELSDGSNQRGDIHILLVGDPGAAKSSMLTFVAKAAPKARYIAGRSASGAGITASVVKDEFMRGWALEAGAMVLANKGILCLDEMDKMSDEDTSALHEAMAQQQISISKANIQATLRAETTVLAAANPKLGRFDPFAPIASQISLPPALINRFDLIFPIRDLPNKEVDERIAQHVLNIHQDATTMNITVDTQTLRKYIAYTKQHINPRLSDGAIDEIKSFYVALRNSGSSSERDIKPIPISARQLESLVRMAEAAARIRLSDSVTRADAKRAVELLKHCLLQVGVDPETGQIDIDRISTGMSSSQRGKIISVREIINDLESKYGKTIPIEDVMSEAAERGLTADKIEEAIEKLKRSGDLYEPKKGFLAKI